MRTARAVARLARRNSQRDPDAAVMVQFATTTLLGFVRLVLMCLHGTCLDQRCTDDGKPIAIRRRRREQPARRKSQTELQLKISPSSAPREPSVQTRLSLPCRLFRVSPSTFAAAQVGPAPGIAREPCWPVWQHIVENLNHDIGQQEPTRSGADSVRLNKNLIVHGQHRQHIARPITEKHRRRPGA